MAVAMGFLVALVTFVTIGDAAYHLPGGSLASGFAIGMSFGIYVRNYSEAMLLLLAGAISGVLGFLLFLALFL